MLFMQAHTNSEMETMTNMGLVRGHAYGVTDVRRFALEGTLLFSTFHKKTIDMVRCRNPWGKHEWNGRFADG